MANPKNRLVEAYTCTSCPGTKLTDLAFSYSVRGETTDVYQSTPHSAGWYHVNGSYWANGALNTLSSNLAGLPALITYGADGEGRPSSISAATGQNPVSSTIYNVAGQVTDVTLGSNDSDHFTYDPNTGRMTQYKFTIGATPQNVIGNLTWNPNGSLSSLAITDPFNAANSQTCAFSHDDLSRVSGANCGSAWSQNFSFDPFGNISKSGSLSFAAGYVPVAGPPNNRIQSGIPNVSYDANGNLLTINDGTSHVYSWDAEGKQIGIDALAATYDAFGRLVELNNSGTYTQTAYGLGGEKLALMNGQTLQKAFVSLPSGTAVYTTAGLSYYRHSDWLGSSRFASTPTTRTMYSDTAYAPYGEPYAEAGTLDRNFTGQNQDVSYGHYDFLFRRMSWVQGRWISPDPLGIGAVDITSPQSWNRYAYVENSPLEFTDPLGLVIGSCGYHPDGTPQWVCPGDTGKCPNGNCGGGSPLPGGGPGGGSGGGAPTGGGPGGGPGGGQGRGGVGGGSFGNNLPTVAKPPNPIICDSIQGDYSRSVNEINVGAWMKGWGGIVGGLWGGSGPSLLGGFLSVSSTFTENGQIAKETKSFGAAFKAAGCSGTLKSPLTN